MAIGRGGQNIRLASMLTGYELDVYRDIKSDEEDVDIDEFEDAIPPEIIQQLKDIGCDTAKAVLELQPSELARRTGLTDAQAQKITWLMEAEFEREEAAAAAARSGDALAGADPDGEAGDDAVADDATVVADLEASSDQSETAEEAVVVEGDAQPGPGDEPVADAETFTEVGGDSDGGAADGEDSAQTDQPAV